MRGEKYDVRYMYIDEDTGEFAGVPEDTVNHWLNSFVREDGDVVYSKNTNTRLMTGTLRRIITVEQARKFRNDPRLKKLKQFVIQQLKKRLNKDFIHHSDLCVWYMKTSTRLEYNSRVNRAFWKTKHDVCGWTGRTCSPEYCPILKGEFDG